MMELVHRSLGLLDAALAERNEVDAARFRFVRLVPHHLNVRIPRGHQEYSAAVSRAARQAPAVITHETGFQYRQLLAHGLELFMLRAAFLLGDVPRAPARL